MLLYIVPTPMNKLDVKQRVSGWRHVPLVKKEKSEWRILLGQLKDKGATCVYSNDLDEEAANTAGDELHIPVCAEFSLRRFNVGRHHASKLDSVADILGRLEKQWKKNADIPIRGGDSLTSFTKRFSRRFNTLLSGTGTAVLVTDVQTINFIRNGMDAHAIVPNGNSVDRNKIYKVTLNSNEQKPHANP